MAAVGASSTLAEVLCRRAVTEPERIAYSFLPGDKAALDLSYRALAERVSAVTQSVAALRGERVLVLCPAGLDYVAALLGCFGAGAIAVPAYPLTRTSLARTGPRLAAIAADCSASAALIACDPGSPEHRALSQALPGMPLIGCHRLAPATVLPDTSLVAAEAPALLQYTSGSTSTPKGVVITHAQLLANLELSRAAGAMSADDVTLSWLPPFHDMGLVGGVCLPLYLGARGVMMPPESFLRRPRRWLAAVGVYRASILMAPNFAFDLCVRRIPAEDRIGLDLASVRGAYNGAEPIHAATYERFVEAFGPHGFKHEAFCPCYGMAEATLMIACAPIGRPPVVRSFAADSLERDRAEPIEDPTGNEVTAGRAHRLVGCGGALLDERILIVEPQSRAALPERSVGEIWVQSRSVGSAYWNQPEESERTFRAYTDRGDGPFLRTGDLGFFDRGALFVTGRLKDLIIVHGLNHYPHDIERTVQAVSPALGADCGAAFSIEDGAVEELVVVQEIDKREDDAPEALLPRIAQAIREGHDLGVRALVLIRRGTLPKTTSGKVQRRATKQAFLAGALDVIAAFDEGGTARVPISAAVPASRARPHTRGELETWLRQRLARTLKRSADELDPHAPLAQYGVDSVAASELTEELERLLGVPLPSTISYDNPTIAELARALASMTGSDEERPRKRTPVPQAGTPALEREPIAIVGMACRVPGAPDLGSFLHALRYGVDAISEVPEDRWDAEALYSPEPGVPGKLCSRWGGFIQDIDGFDAAFFGISPHEAARMDPQQRVFLELAWDALQDAGCSPPALSGSATGVFVGASGSEYARLIGGDLSRIDADFGTGNAGSVIANRLSYLLNLQGPSEVVDSACSSALVALHHACRSLRERECELAVVGAVNTVLTPDAGIYLSQIGALARDGRCKTFDRRADGFVRSEGGGALVLKPLSRAQADRDRIYALVAGSAVNHDGRSNGLLAPNGRAQQRLLRAAFANAGIGPDDLDYVEAHGVGTRLADTVELQALGEVLRGRRLPARVRVGSVKTNVGHLEAAAGIVGVIKAALALHHEELPPHLHLDEVAPDLDLRALKLEIPTVPTGFARGSRPRHAGVSAFGLGGTNAHVVLREAELATLESGTRDRPFHLLTLSAKSEVALQAVARRMAHRLAERDGSFAQLCFSANTGRAPLEKRLAVVASTAERARLLLDAAVRGRAPAILRGRTKVGLQPRIGFVFTDLALRPGVARGLYDDHPSARAILDACDARLQPLLGGSLLQAWLTAPGPESADSAERLARPSYGHALSAALHYALHSLWQAWGITPTVLYGAGAGELSAAAACGVLRFEDAVMQACRRGLVLESLAAGAPQRLSVHAFRSELATLTYQAPSAVFVSAARDDVLSSAQPPDATHFARQLYHVPEPASARTALLATGCDVLLELGPTRTLALEAYESPRVLTALALDGDASQALLQALGELYVRGAEPDFAALDAPYPRLRVSLPSYPFERERHWLEPSDGSAIVERPSAHPLISRVRIGPSSELRPSSVDLADEEGTGND